MSGRNTDPIDPKITVGRRIEFHRRRRGLSRRVLGGLVGRSEEWVKAIEKGRLLPPRLPMLVRIAGVLKVGDLSQLTGDQAMPMPVRTFTTTGHAALPDVRAAINSVAWKGSGPPPPLPHLAGRLAAAWRARHGAPDHRTALGDLLPDLIRDAKHAARTREGAQRRNAQALLAGVYNLAQFYLAYQPAVDLLWRVAERALSAAQESEDARAIGAAVWLLAQAHRDTGDFDAAEAVIREGIELVRPHLGEEPPVELIAMHGAMLFEAAYTAARTGQAGVAWGFWDQAADVAKRLPAGYYDPMTSFSRVIMAPHAVTVAVELRQGAESLRQAGAAESAKVPSRPRRGRHQIELARAYHLNGNAAATVGVLTRAYETAPETIRFNGYARQMIVEFSAKPGAVRDEVSGLAEALDP